MNLQKIKEHWDSRYKKDINYGNIFLSVVNRIMSYKKSGSVIDLGCGVGKNSLFLASKGFNVTAVDISPVALDYLNKQIKTKRLKKKINAKLLDFRKALDKKYDIIIATQILHMLKKEDGHKFVKKIQRNTKKNGLNIIATITNLGDFYKMKHNKKNFYPEQMEFFRLYRKWDILEHHLGWGTAAQKKKNGSPMRNKTIIMVAKKI